MRPLLLQQCAAFLHLGKWRQVAVERFPRRRRCVWLLSLMQA
jgi:hypothetical protein